jgi:toxin YoeB
MRLLWTDEGWESYLSWQTGDTRTLRRLNKIINDIKRSPFEGIGKPEALRGDLFGWWSRRIDDTNRVVYRINGDAIEISQCRGHYGD